MELTRISSSLPAVLACLLLVSQTQAATPPTTLSKLDKQLAPIAEAAEQHVETPLMERALVRQSARTNSPLEARWNTSGQVQVYLHYTPGAAAPSIMQLENIGATDIKQSPELKVIQAWLPAAALKTAAALPGISRVSLPRYALHRRAPVMGPRAETGSATTEGDQILGSAAFRFATGITGQGISVGVISDGDDHINDSQKTGDLPATIVNDPNDAGSFKSTGDEGTAMMEIVYDIAPGVKQLGFCGPQTTADFITCLGDFAKNIDANVIVDDLAFPGVAMFNDDNFNTAILNFTAAHPDIRLVTATGNDGGAYWQGAWQPQTTPVSTAVNGITYTQAQNFGENGITLVPYLQIDNLPVGDKIAYQLEWNDPWSDKATTPDPNDYDVVVFDNPNGDGSSATAAGHRAVACNQGENISGGTLCNQANSSSTTSPGPQPAQGSVWTATQSIYYLGVFEPPNYPANAPGPNLKVLVYDVSKPAEITLNPSTPGSIYGHAALAYPTELSVGAIYAPDALSGLYGIEPYSSQGPVEYGIAGATARSIQKPDFVAPDCVSVTGAGGFSNPFCGTSAAAPHMAGLVALLMAGYPGQPPYTLLQQASVQPGFPNPNGTFGSGLPIMTRLLQAGTYPVPAASISAPADGTSMSTGQMVAFKGGCTAYKAVTGVKTDWNFGSGSGIADSTQANPSVSFKNAGSYTVTLSCTDTTGSSTATVTVKATSPSGGGSLDLVGLMFLGLASLLRRRQAGASSSLH